MPLKVYTLNCTLKASPEESNTQALVGKVAALFEDQGAVHGTDRLADFHVPAGITADTGDGDNWPKLLKKVEACDIFVLATPIWMGVRGSLAQRVVERLDGSAGDTNALGQPPFMGKVAGCIVTGNEDGAHSAAGVSLYNLTHLGFAVPPLADCYWVGKAGPGKSYIKAGGDRHLYTNRTARYMVHSTMHLARLLRDKPFDYDINKLDEQAQAVSD